jgi:TatD DNase family protein
MIDTHSHIYSEEFDADRTEMIQRAKSVGVEHIILPNVDSESLSRMLKLESEFPGYCHAAIGLHPTSVNENFETELNIVESELKSRKWIAIGEIGIDLYWDKTYYNQQVIVLTQQIEWAIKFNLPVIIHIRDSFDETLQIMAQYQHSGLKGVFHSFTGTCEQAEKLLEYEGFMLGINGVVTFKNSRLTNALEKVPLSRLVLETDAPYLAPVPYRGKRNESSYLRLIAEKLSEIYKVPYNQVENQTTENAIKIFRLKRKTE